MNEQQIKNLITLIEAFLQGEDSMEYSTEISEALDFLCKSYKDIQTSTQGYECNLCYRPSQYVRCTQFAGKHYYCQEHAELEDDFMIDGDDYWLELKESNKGLK